MSVAIRSTTCSRSASVSVADDALADRALHPRGVAAAALGHAARLAAMSFTIFSDMAPPISWPPAPTGWAAPMLVPGAMAAMSAARVIITPAEAARAPLGATKTDHRHGAGEDVLDDAAHGFRQPAGRVELDHHAPGAVQLGFLEAVVDELGRARADGVGDAHEVGFSRVGGRRGRQQGRQREQRDESTAGAQRRPRAPPGHNGGPVHGVTPRTGTRS